MKRRAFTLPEVLLALVLAVLFLVLTSQLELLSIRFLSQLHRREQATLVAQETINQLRARTENNELPTPFNVTVQREGVPYVVHVDVSPAVGAGALKGSNLPVALDAYETRSAVVEASVRWTDERGPQIWQLSQVFVLTSLSAQEPKK